MSTLPSIPSSTSSTSLTVVDAPGLVTVQDAGRPGLAHLGVPRAGWLDAPAAGLANRLVGNSAGTSAGTAVLEVIAGLRVRLGAGRWVAVTGARCEVRIGGAARGHGRAEWVPPGAEVRLGPALDGVRSYLAVAGGITVEPVLGSRSTDTLAWVGPPRVQAGAVLPVGEPVGPPAALDVPAPVVALATRPRGLRLRRGPRADWFVGDVLRTLGSARYVVAAHSNRVGLRLEGPPLERAHTGELPSEGIVLGAVQVPADGRPVVFLADHPTTGGYPVVAVVDVDDLPTCAQLRPGDEIRFTVAP